MRIDPQRVQAVFLMAIELVDSARRPEILARECGADLELRQRIEALLVAHDQPFDLLEHPLVDPFEAEWPFSDNTTMAFDSLSNNENVAGARSPVRRSNVLRVWKGGDNGMVLDCLQPSTKPGSLGRLGHYEVLELLGRGGFGVVYKAFDEMLHRVVAIKVMAPHLASTSPARKRFLREARAAAAIRHENIVDIHAVEEEPVPYLVMEYIPGQTLQQKLDDNGPLDAPLMLRLGYQIASGLAAAHAIGLIHRDIKPSNILLEIGTESRVKITDFGLARAADDASLTQSGMIAGTPLYMAPEQAQGESIDQRADLFSLGSVLYVMCSGRPPFRASNTLAVLKRVVEDTPRPIREIIPEVPECLCEIISRLHAKKPADRFQSAKEVVDLLGHYVSDLKQHGSLQSLQAIAPSVSEPLPAASTPARSVSRRFRRRIARPRPWAFASLIGAIVLAVLGIVTCLYVWTCWLPSGPSIDPKAPVVFRVEANQVWQDTGVDVVEGEAIVLIPEGIWQKGKQVCPARGLEQAPRERAVCLEAPLMCLLARVGDKMTVTPVQDREVFKPKHSGRLFVQANDLDLEANEGGLQLTITGGLRLGTAPPPGLLPIQLAERDWKPFMRRVEFLASEPARVREEVFDYCRKYPGTGHAFRAGKRLIGLPPLVNSIRMKLAPLPPGKFVMGSPDAQRGRFGHEGPQHEVTLTSPFYVGTCAVTVGQFRAFVNDKCYKTEAEKGEGAWRLFPDGWKLDPLAQWQNPGFEQTDEHPVVCVSWNDAQAFCAWLTVKEGKPYALPTEAQWEYCCRAGSQTRYSFGDDEQELEQYAWFEANAGEQPHPVGLKKANPWGLYDMHGNVWQWTADWYAADTYQKSTRKDPLGPSVGTTRVLRGGGWRDPRGICYSGFRNVYGHPTSCHAIVGFRVVLLQ